MEPPRRRSATQALRLLDDEIDAAKRELAALERARDVLSRSVNALVCDSAIASGGTTCAGHRHFGRCQDCGYAVAVCEHHDGARTVAKLLASHQRRCRGTPFDDATPDAAEPMPDDAPLPVGQLSLSPGAGRRSERLDRE